ncbi:MAG: recombinase family protein, partial [Propionibacteriaceae bacterium]|nr:recombinase family protein [Propionibacteriaceae bacterium]
IDNSPEGQFMQGILSAMNQFRSQQDGADIAYKMGEKAKKGGTLGRAPIGYLNITEKVDGHDVHTVAVDPERAPFVREAFQMYADGHTLQEICDILGQRGFTSKGTENHPSAPLTDGKMAQLIRDPYYLGHVKYKGELYPGRHQAIVGQDLFDQVQTIAATRGVTGQRHRIHDHLLKGLLWCGQCHENGVENRMILNRAQGNGGTYWYYACAGRTNKALHPTTPYINAERLEQAVARYYQTTAFDPEFIESMRESLATLIKQTATHERQLKKQVNHLLTDLESREDRLAQLAEEGTLPAHIIQRRLDDIAIQRNKALSQSANVAADIKTGANHIEQAIQFLKDPAALYNHPHATDEMKKQLSAVIFKKIYVYEDQVTGAQYTEGLARLKDLERQVRAEAAKYPANYASKQQAAITKNKTGLPSTRDRITDPTGRAKHFTYHGRFTRYLLTSELSLGAGSSKTPLVPKRGVEPPRP